MKNLPVVWNWCAGDSLAKNGLAASPGPEWQLEQINAGRPLIPTIKHQHKEVQWAKVSARLTPLVLKAKELGLPLILRSTNVFYDIAGQTSGWNYFKQFSTDPLDYLNHAWLVQRKTYTAEQLLTLFPNGITKEQLPLHVEGTNNTIVSLNIDGGADYYDIDPKSLSLWSYNTAKWCRQLGYLFGTTDLVKAIAELYPEPNIIFFADNDEMGFVMEDNDILEPPAYTKVKAGLTWAETDPNYWVGYAMKRDLKKYLLQISRSRMMIEFDQGFAEGLATHNKHWAKVAGWVNYSECGHEFGDGRFARMYFTNNLSFFRDSLTDTSWRSGDHKYGSTGSTYLQSWYGDWNLSRCWMQISNNRMYRDNAEVYSGPKPRFDLLWEGENRKTLAKPNRENWRTFVKCALWMGQSEYFGHFCYSDTRQDAEQITVYYDECLNAAQEVRDNPILRDFWENGTLVKSIDHKPNVQEICNPLLEDLPWYYLHIEENDRYDTDKNQWTDQPGFHWDLWRRNSSNRSLVKAVAFAFEKENEYLLFVASVLNPMDKITIRLTKDQTIEINNPPIGGKFYLVNKIDLTYTEIN